MLSPTPVESSTTQHHAEQFEAGEHAALVCQDHAATVEPALPRPHPFPTVRSGGLFVLLVGIATLASTLLSGTPALQGIVFAASFTLAIAIGLVLLRRRLSYGTQTRTQRLAVIGAMGLETVMIVAIVNVVRPQDPRTLWLFLAVGIHFLPFLASS